MVRREFWASPAVRSRGYAHRRCESAVFRYNRINAIRLPSSVSLARSEGFDLIVNASSMGMRADDPLPSDLGGLTADAIVGESSSAAS